jgi:hypothetical protein
MAGLIASCVLPLAHTVPAAGFPLPHADGLLADSWSAHQVATTVDFARRNWILNWLLGGLNFQIEHYLFPRICQVDYPALSEIVEATCREFGVPYHAYPSFGAAIAAHYRWLRILGPDHRPRPGEVRTELEEACGRLVQTPHPASGRPLPVGEVGNSADAGKQRQRRDGVDRLAAHSGGTHCLAFSRSLPRLYPCDRADRCKGCDRKKIFRFPDPRNAQIHETRRIL